MRRSTYARLIILIAASVVSKCSCQEQLLSTVPDLPQVDVCVTPSPGAEPVCYMQLKAEHPCTEEPCPLPHLAVALPEFGPNETLTTDVVVRSIGDVPLEIYAPVRDSGDSYALRDAPDAGAVVATLEPGEEHTFTVELSASACGTHGGTFVFYSNDAEYPDGAIVAGARERADDPILVDLAGTMTGVPQVDVCVTPSPGADEVCYEALKEAHHDDLCGGGGDCLLPSLTIDLGDLPVNVGGQAQIVIRSAGEADLLVYAPTEDFSVDDYNVFRVEGSPVEGEVIATLAPGDEHTVTLNARGFPCGVHTSRFRVLTNDSRCIDIDPTSDFQPGQPDDPIIIDVRANISGACVCPRDPSRDLQFGSVALGQSKVLRYTVESCGDQPLTVTDQTIGIDAGGAYSLDNVILPAGNVLQPGEVGHLDVRYTPQVLSAIGAQDVGQLWVFNDSPASPDAFCGSPAGDGIGCEIINLVGRAIQAPTCELTAVPSYTDFGIVTSSATRQVRLINDGEIACRIYDVQHVSGSNDFSIAAGGTPPDVDLLPTQSHFLGIDFTPVTSGAQMATFEVTADDVNGTVSHVTVRVEGTNEVPQGSTCFLQIEPEFVDFGDVSVGDVVQMDVTVRNLAENIGFPICNIESAEIVAGQPDFHGGDAGLLSSFFMPPGGQTTITIYFEPDSEGQKQGTLALRSAGGDFDVPLYGNALGPKLCVDVNGIVPATTECGATVPCDLLDFGAITPGAPVERDVTLTSCGEGTLHVRGLNLDPAGSPTFTQVAPASTAFPIRLGPGASTTVTIRYAPLAGGGDFGGLDVISTASVEVARVALRGNYAGGCDSILRCNPPDPNFGTQEVGVTELRTTVCTNFGTAPLTIRNVTLTGSSDFALASGTYAELAPGETFPIQITCTPSAQGVRTTNGQITSNACDTSPLGFVVSCNGLIPDYPQCIGSTTFSPLEKWRWTSSSRFPTYDDVWTTPAVVNLTDDNGDGRFDVLDTPDIVFTALKSAPPPLGTSEEEFCKANDPAPAVMIAVSGDDGHELWTFGVLPSPGNPGDPRALAFDSEGNVAVGDIDSDGKPEVIGVKYSYFAPTTGCQALDTSCCIEGKYAWGRLIALEHDGSYKWESERFHLPDGFIENAAAPALGDMNGDGLPEIALGNAVFDHDGRLLFEGQTETQNGPGHGEGGAGHGVFSAFADLDGDGANELVAGRTAFRYDGSIFYDVSDMPDGMVTIADLDSDPLPEIIIFTGFNELYVRENDGSPKHGPVHLPSGNLDENGNEEGYISTNPAVGDLDGDGSPEIVVAATALLYALEHDTSIKWTAEVFDGTGMSGPTTFDFEGDGRFEVVYADEGSIGVFNGLDGAVKYDAPRSSRTIADNPVVADVDNDGHADIILAMESMIGALGMHGLIVYGNVDNNWVATRRVWNQHSYHITNVSESGVIPAREGAGWTEHNVYRSNVIRCE